MRRYIVAAAVAALALTGCNPSSPPSTAPTSSTAPTTTEPVYPPGDPGLDHPSITFTGQQPAGPEDIGTFRTNCRFSHLNADDPIVYPAQPGRSHLHSFFGNTSIDAWTTTTDAGRSTCEGGTANRSAYWSPTVLDSAGEPVRNTAFYDVAFELTAYYKAGYDGVASSSIQPFPQGLRMVAGDATATAPQDLSRVWWSCGVAGAQQAQIPACPPGDELVGHVEFPQCWNGVDLDSPDHRSHMAYGAGWPDKGCPASHPVPLIQITQLVRYRVPPQGMAGWHLASDMGGTPGRTLHADWWNGWDPAVMAQIVEQCIRPSLNCGVNLLGDGNELTY